MNQWLKELQGGLDRAGGKAARRQLRIIESVDGPRVRIGDRELLNLCHNDYLALSRDPEVLNAACRALRDWGAGAGASRLITGTSRLVMELEEELAALKGAGTALVFPTGYQANLGLCSALISREDVVFIDRLAHACLVDGARLAGARLRVFPHNDVNRLSELLAAHRTHPRRWILVDGVFSMDGDVAPLPDLLRLCDEHDARLILDDAHGTGVLGVGGGGTAEHFGIAPRDHADRLIIMATLSKALGSQGGVVLGPAVLRDWLVNRARSFIYTTGLAPSAVGAALASARIIRREPQRVRLLQERTRRSLETLRRANLDTMNSHTPVIPINLVEADAAIAASERLAAQGILALPIRPPTVPRKTSRLRITASLHPTDSEWSEALDSITSAASGELR